MSDSLCVSVCIFLIETGIYEPELCRLNVTAAFPGGHVVILQSTLRAHGSRNTSTKTGFCALCIRINWSHTSSIIYRGLEAPSIW